MYFGFSALLTAVFTRPLGGLLLLVLVAIPARIGSGSVTITAFEIAIPLCLFIELSKGVSQERERAAPPSLVTIPVVAFYLLALASGFWAMDSRLWLNRAVVLTEALAAGWVVYLAVMRMGTDKFMRVLAWSTTVGAAWAVIWFYLLGHPVSLNLQPPIGPDASLAQALRLGSPLFGPSNYYASFLIVSIPATFYLCRKGSIYWWLLIVQVFAFVETLSRGGVLALLLAAAVVLLIRQLHVGRLPHGLALVAALIAAVFLVPQVPGAVNSLLAQRQETTLTGSGLAARVDLWQVAIDLWRTHPFLGIGEGTWDSAVNPEFQGQAHNVLLNILAELGVFGLLIAVFALLAILVMTWRISDARLRYCCLIALLGSFINCLSEATFEGAVFTWFLGVFLGGVMAASAMSTKPTKDRVMV
jgi:O-antigen ligase